MSGKQNGGVFTSPNLGLYTYSLNDPIRFLDPNGMSASDRAWGALKVVGGGAEAFAGGVFGFVTAETGIGAVAGGLVMVHGCDVMSTGFKEMWTGESQSSLTSQAIQATGVSRGTADKIDAGISVVGTLGTSYMTSAPRLAPTMTVANQTSDHIVLGLNAFGLEQTAAQVGGRTLMSDSNWKTTLINALANPSTKLTVSLDGMAGASAYSKVMSAAQKGMGPAAQPTNWEMAQLYQAGRLKDATFMEGGKVVPNPFQ